MQSMQPEITDPNFCSGFCLAALEKTPIFLQNCVTQSGMENLAMGLRPQYIPSQVANSYVTHYICYDYETLQGQQTFCKFSVLGDFLSP